MTQPDRNLTAAVADLSAVIERASVDLALSEEPSGFLAVLESDGEAAPPEERRR